MVEGFEVVVQYRGEKYNQVASPATASAEFAILKKDLAHLRVHSPSQKNVRRVDGSFILQWPTAGTSPKVDGLTDSLHTRWFRLCSDDPEAHKLRDFLSIQSITLTQNGVLICSTTGAGQASQVAPPGTLAKRLGDTPAQPVPAPVPTSIPAKPQPPPPPPPKRPPSGLRLERQQAPHLKRRLSGVERPPSPTVTRQKMDMPEAQTTNPPRPTINQPAPTHPSGSPREDRQQAPSAETRKASPKPARDDHTTARTHTPTQPNPPSQAQTIRRSPTREPGEMTPQKVPGPPPSGPGPIAHASPARPHPRHPRTSSPYPGSVSSGSGRREHDASGLTRELWDTRRQLTALQAREQVILDDLERLGARPNEPRLDRVTREDLSRLEAELRAERDRRVRAERALSDVERECRAPFVVPALFQAFMSITELSN